MEIDEGNQIVDVHKDGALTKKQESTPSDKGGAAPDGHRSITGTIESFDQRNKRVTIQSEEGKLETFDLKDAAFTKLNTARKGEKVTLEIDERNRVMDAHKG